jgi:TatD DNase family protein
LDDIRGDVVQSLTTTGLHCAIVNGTRESDWPAVAALAEKIPWVRPSFGLHPWNVPTRSPEWRETLAEFLARFPTAGIGEIGIDRWVKDHDLPEQLDCFRWQMDIAARENRVTSIHCIQAWGALLGALQSAPLPARGFLIHAYGGPLEMLPAFVKLGAYFSFSPYFIHERKSAQRAAFAAMPADRILVETDAPDLAPPAERNPFTLAENINDPRNIATAYSALSEVRQLPLDTLAEIVAENFRRWTD